ncbi:uncharacterized protein LOC110859000 isoform X2 [Folsomia candida]|uniref:uncharacterized protein LOC110859000 isoform X2 n=1 Tax=Folsomia candida TaxID=158441 RepID=UPI000B8F129A|nr:uncharacterized protein LOC110859000 isoform X2 [Folsomia candida]
MNRRFLPVVIFICLTIFGGNCNLVEILRRSKRQDFIVTDPPPTSGTTISTNTPTHTQSTTTAPTMTTSRIQSPVPSWIHRLESGTYTVIHPGNMFQIIPSTYWMRSRRATDFEHIILDPTDTTTNTPTGRTSTTTPPFIVTDSPTTVSSTAKPRGQIMTWKFKASNCRIEAKCPCSTVTTTFSNCGDNYDHLQGRRGIFLRFCEINRATRPVITNYSNTFDYTSNPDVQLEIMYVPNTKGDSTPDWTGLYCFVTCTGRDQVPQIPPGENGCHNWLAEFIGKSRN